MSSPFCRRFCYLLAILLLAGGSGACRKRKPPVEIDPAKVASELRSNQLGGLEGPIYQSQVNSSIRWQKWTPETFERAKAAKRLVFAVIAMPELPDYKEVIANLERDSAIVNIINEDYVPVLVDGDASRELGLLAMRLCTEIKQPLEMPVFVWLSSDANPVAWIPVSGKQGEAVFKLFNQSNEMVSKMWKESSDYVMSNSKLDNEARSRRMIQQGTEAGVSENPAEDSMQAMRQLNALYDPYSRTIDSAGGLYPTGVMESLVTAALIPGVPESLREKSVETTKELLKDLTPSAMFDPLEGGVFSARASGTWALPNFTWNCRVQARVATNLFKIHQLTADPVALDRARGLLAFAEKKFQLENGLFVDGNSAKSTPQNWLWSMAELEEALPPEDAKWWAAATGMEALGNLPSESDPQRQFFRSNTLALVRPLAETAAQLSVPPAEFTKRFEASRVKLAAVRESRMKDQTKDASPNVGSNLRMISAYAAAFAATGEEAYREKAVKLLELTREKFAQENRFSPYGQVAEPSITAGRAFVYALAIQAAQDVADITSDEAPARWADELATTIGEIFLVDGIIREVPAEARIVDLPISDNHKIFDDSTTGLLLLAKARATAGGNSASPAWEKLPVSLSQRATTAPIFYTDAITAAMVEAYAPTLVRGSGLSAELKSALERLPVQLFPRRAAKDSDGIPTGSVRVILPDGSGKLVSDPSALRDELLLPR